MAQCSVCQAWCHRECFGLSDIEEEDAAEPTKRGEVFRTDDGSQFYCSDECREEGDKNAGTSTKRKRKSRDDEVDFPIICLSICPPRLSVCLTKVRGRIHSARVSRFRAAQGHEGAHPSSAERTSRSSLLWRSSVLAPSVSSIIDIIGCRCVSLLGAKAFLSSADCRWMQRVGTLIRARCT
jgi:hypothetical protein